MISFIDEHRSVLGVEPICRLLPIAPSTYYEVVAKRTDVDRLSARTRCDMAMQNAPGKGRKVASRVATQKFRRSEVSLNSLFVNGALRKTVEGYLRNSILVGCLYTLNHMV